MFSTAEAIGGGFGDPVFDGQSVFRAVMDAMARPGTIAGVGALAAPPAPLSATAAAIALTLCDHDTPLWLDARLAGSEAVRTYLGFHSGAPFADRPVDAAFALVADPAALVELSEFSQGTQEYPDRSTTLILQVDALWSDAGAAPHPHPHPHPHPVKDGERGAPALASPPPAPALASPSPRPSRGEGEGQRQLTADSLILVGPGIESTASLSISPLPSNFVALWQENCARFPRGVDLILAAPGRIACLPRTTRIRKG